MGLRRPAAAVDRGAVDRAARGGRIAARAADRGGCGTRGGDPPDREHRPPARRGGLRRGPGNDRGGGRAGVPRLRQLLLDERVRRRGLDRGDAGVRRRRRSAAHRDVGAAGPDPRPRAAEQDQRALARRRLRRGDRADAGPAAAADAGPLPRGGNRRRAVPAATCCGRSLTAGRRSSSCATRPASRCCRTLLWRFSPTRC